MLLSSISSRSIVSIAIICLTAWRALAGDLLPAIFEGAANSDLATYVDVHEVHTAQERKTALGNLLNSGLITLEEQRSLGTFVPELKVLEILCSKGFRPALITAADLMVEEVMNPHYSGNVGSAAAIQALFNYGYATNRKSEIETALMNAMETMYGLRHELRKNGYFNSQIMTPDGRVFLNQVISPDLIFNFYLRRLKEKEDPYAIYAVRHLLNLKTLHEAAFKEISFVVKECEHDDQVELAIKIIGRAAQSLSPINLRIAWLEELLPSLSNSALREEVETQIKNLKLGAFTLDPAALKPIEQRLREMRCMGLLDPET